MLLGVVLSETLDWLFDMLISSVAELMFVTHQEQHIKRQSRFYKGLFGDFQCYAASLIE